MFELHELGLNLGNLSGRAVFHANVMSEIG